MYKTEASHFFQTSSDLLLTVSKPWHGKKSLAPLTASITKLALWTLSTAYVFDQSLRNHLYNLHPALPLVTLVTTFTLGLLLKKASSQIEINPIVPVKSARYDVKQIILEVPNDLDFDSFSKYVLEENPPEKMKILINESLLKNKKAILDEAGKEISYKKIFQSREAFEELISQKVSPKSLTITTNSEWFDYSDENAVYVDYANKLAGGSWRSGGNVQEERMFLEIPKIPLITYLESRNEKTIYCTKEGKEPPHTLPEPFLFENLQRYTILDPKTYGREVYKIDSAEIPQYVTNLERPSPKFHVVGIAAVYWNEGKNERYTTQALKYKLQAAYLAFTTGKGENIHTGLWGCGVFSNSVPMMIAIQILAAKMAGAALVFHGISDPDLIDNIRSEIDELLKTKTPAEILYTLRHKQTEDPNWRPR